MAFEKIYYKFADLKIKDKHANESVLVGFPFVAYKLKITKSSLKNNIIDRTIVALAQEYKKNTFDDGVVIDKISQKLDLDRIFVKMVLKNHKHNLNRETSNGELEQIDVEYSYVFYDIINQSFLNASISEKEYDDFTQNVVFDETNKAVVRKDIASSNGYNIYLVPNTTGNNNYPMSINELVMERMTSKRMIDGTEKLQKCEDAGLIENVILVTKCYYDKRNLSMFNVRNPLESGSLSIQLAGTLKAYIDMHCDCKLNQKIQGLANSARKKADELLASSNKLLESQIKNKYPELSMFYPSLLKWLINIEASYSGLSDMRKVNPNSNSQEAKDYKDGFAISHYTFLENIIPCIFSKYMRAEDEYNINEELSKIKNIHKKDDVFQNYVRNCGFDILESDLSFLKDKGKDEFDSNIFRTLVYIFKNSEYNESEEYSKLHVYFIGCCIQALFNKEHVLYRIVQDYPDFLTVLAGSKVMRDISKHNNKDGIYYDFDKIEYLRALDYYILSEFLDESVEDDTQDSNEISDNDTNKTDTLDQVYAAQGQAQLILDSYEELKENITAKKLCEAYVLQKDNYMTCAYNLMEEVFGLVLSETTDSHERIRVSRRFTYDAKRDDTKIRKMLLEYNIDITQPDFPPKTDVLRGYRDRNNENISLGVKMYMLIFAWDMRRPELKNKLLLECPDIIYLIYENYDGRGHSKVTDFSDSSDKYLSFNERVLKSCNYLLSLLRGMNYEQ